MPGVGSCPGRALVVTAPSLAVHELGHQGEIAASDSTGSRYPDGSCR